jgi:hypothetical protein
MNLREMRMDRDFSEKRFSVLQSKVSYSPVVPESFELRGTQLCEKKV